MSIKTGVPPTNGQQFDSAAQIRGLLAPSLRLNRAGIRAERLPAIRAAGQSSIRQSDLSLARLSFCGPKWPKAAGTLYVRDAKTAKGVREVHLSPALRETLTLWKADAKHAAAAELVIATATGGKQNPSNLRRDVLTKTVAAANERLEAADIAPIGALTFHGLRRTYASLRCVCGDDVRFTADQLGHEDPRFTLRCFAQASKRRDRMVRPQREAFDAAIEWAAMDSNEPLTVPGLRIEATRNPA